MGKQKHDLGRAKRVKNAVALEALKLRQETVRAGRPRPSSGDTRDDSRQTVLDRIQATDWSKA